MGENTNVNETNVTPVMPTETPAATETPVTSVETSTTTQTSVTSAETPAATQTPVTPTETPVATQTPVTPMETPVATQTSVVTEMPVQNPYTDNTQTNNQTTYTGTITNAEPFSKGLAIASLVLGICSLLFACCCTPLGIILGIIGVILGCIQKPDPATGKKPGIAIAGIICSAVGIVGSIISAFIGAATAISSL